MDTVKMQLYQAIVSQLQDDGFAGAASTVAQATLVPRAAQSKDYLARMVKAGHSFVRSDGKLEGAPGQAAAGASGGRADIQLDLAKGSTSDHQPKYTTKFVTTHKAPCRVAKFSSDGALVATASADASIKILAVAKLLTYNQQARGQDNDFAATKPVLRTLYNHTQPVTDLDWHPYASTLASCAKDSCIKFFDCTNAGSKHAYQSIQDTHCVNSIAYHPSGDFVLAGTDHNYVHMYDVKTLQCYTPQEHHAAGINQVRCASDGKQYATASKDGSVKLWDITTNKCTATLVDAHDKLEVTSVSFSKNSKYLLSAGKNSTIVLWDLATRLPLVFFRGHRHGQRRAQATFTYDEQHVVAADDCGNCDLLIWSSRTGALAQRCNAGHNAPVRWVTHSPVAPQLMTCSDDHRGRFWLGTAPS